MIPKAGWKVGAIFGRMAVRSVLLAMVSGMLWLSPAPAQEKTAPDEARLSDLTIWQGPAFGTGTADFGSSIEKGLESLGNALEKAVTPQLGDRLALTPPFREDVGSYSVTIGYRMMAISVAASRGDPGAVITMTGRVASGSDGGNLAAARATVTRLRLGLEGARPFSLGAGGALTPSFEIGMRHDGGDAETGFGVDMGGGIAWTVPKYGLQIELRGRGLLTHEAKGFRQRGFSGSLAWDPKPSSARGPALSLTRTVGGAASGGADALLAHGTLTGLGAQPGVGDHGDLRNRRLEARFGYGFPAWGGRFASVPEIGLGLSGTGREYILGWRLADDGSRGSGRFQLSTEARRIETAVGSGPAEHRIGVRLSARW